MSNFNRSADMHVQGPQINQFNNIAPMPIPRSAFRRDFTRRSTFNQDYLVPIFVDEILPGDDVSVRLTALVRVATPIKPIMDNLYFETFWFFIPNRLTWSNWEKFQGEQINPGDSVAYTIPVLNNAVAPMSTTGFTNESIYDYFGLPTLVTSLDGISSLFNRAYDLVYNDWFRDENLQNSIAVPSGDGPDNPADYTLRKRNKRKDYFTSMLPWPQKGEAVTISMGGFAPVLGIGKTSNLNAGWVNGPQDSAESDGQTVQYSRYQQINWANTDARFVVEENGTTGYPNIRADLAQATPIELNVLRQAAIYQQILELDARGGTRYVESIYSRFGVISPDFRLQRPELIGQASTRINVYAVPQTAEGTSTPQGNLAAFGTGQIHGDHGCRYSATEHGIIIGLANVRADLTYQQGIPKMFTRSTRLDFYEPLQNGLGEQAVLNGELYAQGTATDQDVAGYQERWAEMRFKNSEITGKFRSNDPQTLDVWHLSQEFGALPVLNSSFITEDVPMERVLAVENEPAFLFDGNYAYNHVRPMPIRSNPGITRL